MKLKAILAAFALIGAGAMVATSADAQTAQTKKKTVVYNRDRTVIVSRDEDGRTRTRIIIQKRSYLDPGTESFPGERGRNTDYVERPNQRAVPRGPGRRPRGREGAERPRRDRRRTGAHAAGLGRHGELPGRAK